MIQQITNSEYEFLRDLIHRESGISLTRLRREILTTRLMKRLRELKLDGFSEYCGLVERSGDELTNLLNIISTNVTHFFREPAQLDLLRSEVLPELIAARPPKIRIWSAGCSTGEEPYSLGMTYLETLERCGVSNTIDFKILASDISTRVLSTAETGVYNKDAVTGSVDDGLIKKYFTACSDAAQCSYRVKERLKGMMIFKQINLTDPVIPIRGAFDIIFCRNVLIYFDRETQSKVVTSMLRFLKPGGLFFCGHSESMVGQRPDLRMISSCVYRKDDKGSRDTLAATA